jgi:feruloyl esterase
MWVSDATLKIRASYIPKEKFSVIHEVALKACDAQDGIKDDTIDDPASCRFDPGVQCPAEDVADCQPRRWRRPGRSMPAPAIRERAS